MAAGAVNLASVGIGLTLALPLAVISFYKHKRIPAIYQFFVLLIGMAGVWSGVELLMLIFTCGSSFPEFKCATPEMGKFAGQELAITFGGVGLFIVSSREIVSVATKVWQGDFG